MCGIGTCLHIQYAVSLFVCERVYSGWACVGLRVCVCVCVFGRGCVFPLKKMTSAPPPQQGQTCYSFP
jgi:hypothetical protein